MRKIIRNRQVVDDGWTYLAPGDAVPASGDVVLPLATFVADPAAALARQGRLGVRLEPGEGVGELVPHLARIALVAVNFPTFYDGRGLSYARELRERHRYTGEIRAVGDVMRDQLLGMARCGFDAFDLKEGQSFDVALTAFDDFSTAYQADTHESRPVYRRA